MKSVTCIRNHPDSFGTTKVARSVRFSPFSTLHAYDDKREECTSSWYSPSEEDRFKEEARLDILAYKLMLNGVDASRLDIYSNGIITPVGLEKQLLSNENTKQRAITRRMVTVAVLAEQARHSSRSCNDKDDLIAAASMQHSEWSRTQAETIGSFQAIRSKH